MAKKITFLALFFMSLSYLSFSQNSKSIKIWQRVLVADTISDLNKKINYCETLKLEILNFREEKDSIYAKVLHIQGRGYWNIGKLEIAKTLFTQAIKINSQIKKSANEKHLSLSYMNRATIEYSLKDYENSIADYNNAVELMIKNNYRFDFIAQSLSQVSTIYWLIGDFNKSIQIADKAISFSKSDNELILIAQIQKIQSLIQLKEIDKAYDLAFGQMNLAKHQKTNKVDLANLYTLFGKVLIIKQKFILAKSYFNKSIILHKSINYNFGVATSMIEMAVLLKIEKKYIEALLYANKSIAFADGDQMFILRANDEIGIINKIIGNYEIALQVFQSAFKGFFQLNLLKDINQNPNPKLLSGKVDNDILLPLIQHKAETWLAYYHHTQKVEYLQNALATFEVADKMVDYMRQEHVGYQSKLFWRDKTHQLYENAIEVCYLLKNYEKAFYFFEKSRAVLLNDKINNLAANQLLSDTDQLKERNFQQQTAELNAKLDQSQNDAERSKINLQLLDVQEAQQTFIKNIAQKYPSYYRLKYNTTMYSLASMKAYLKQRKTSFIEYFKGDSAQYQLIIKPTGEELIKQKINENIFQKITIAQDLGSRIIISQDGDFVPLDTLKSPNGQYLLQKYAISYTYSAQYLLKNTGRVPQNSYFNNFIGFAPVTYSKSMLLPDLLGADKALDKVSKFFFWDKTFTHKAATKANFTKNVSDFKIIQLFTHADADNINKEPTIFFADSAFKVSDLEGLKKINAELLVLSACKTNVGKIAKGEGTLSMAREFAGLGIPASITTLWSVENEATYLITELFYKYLEQGKPKDIALQKAKLDYLTLCSREKQAPIFWSGFVLVGESDPIIFVDAQNFAFIAILFLIMVALVVYFKKRKQVSIK